jgi:hypothetical protein
MFKTWKNGRNHWPHDLKVLLGRHMHENQLYTIDPTPTEISVLAAKILTRLQLLYTAAQYATIFEKVKRSVIMLTQKMLDYGLIEPCGDNRFMPTLAFSSQLTGRMLVWHKKYHPSHVINKVRLH